MKRTAGKGNREMGIRIEIDIEVDIENEKVKMGER